ncbi:MAG: GTP 3',8-cyclase MoaA [Verrucomicrobiota bacterium]|jgi:cyclic pyranopterin phosphate synthase|nr:GTP 3',8-cyclase MoaA [Verrucomicrobiota bacterium]MDP7051767.1 GTP 3',8-cyclase MoaA [Verrucomicrobiota bacterium]
MSHPGVLQDSQNRVIRDLRISITDRCNFKCVYCLPKTEEPGNIFPANGSIAKKPALLSGKLPYPRKSRSQLLSFEEIARVARVAASLGVEKIRITGGEPLLRRGVESLISQIAGIEPICDLSLTTNGTNFPRLAKPLKEAGLGRVTLSLDSLDRENFRKITGRDALTEVLVSIRLAKSLGLTPVKINAVIIRGFNDHEIVSLARFAVEEDIIMRFIEFMPLDARQLWHRDHVVSGSEIIKQIETKFPLTPLPSGNPSETSTRWSLGQGAGEIGIIASVTQPFCDHCNRLRLTADGKIRTCLFSHHEHDLKPCLQDSTAGDEALATRLRQIVLKKEPGHRISEPDFVQPARTMSLIGG